jgi:hypothetical protein
MSLRPYALRRRKFLAKAGVRKTSSRISRPALPLYLFDLQTIPIELPHSNYWFLISPWRALTAITRRFEIRLLPLSRFGVVGMRRKWYFELFRRCLNWRIER